MGNTPAEQSKSWKQSIKAPLSFSLVMAIIAGVIATIAGTGGTDNPWRLDIGLVAFGVTFVACLLVISVMTMAGKENPEDLGTGSGVNKSSITPDSKPKNQH
ncbi:MAG: hypothetical protein ABWX63_06040 [Paeniglutamicibacter terrestris]|jgi:hypothetical protein|uniref:Amino acid transporter n=1 Tax=Paeniglutamicibacter terrestris TaxID=2723403 RepID=A0ABX1G1Z1_9MICC|nr:hypothetical protein [Paeniglutamicibacter terrestris]ASN37756.1 hypothetical protein CGQ24_01195 [Arthrobacter sp. 7749]NKG20059.1 hypothetical protein [Paeniglutamicibacter terrestris]